MAMFTSQAPISPVATVIVAADGSGDYDTVQEGIDSLPAGGGVVYIKEGTYTISAAIEIHKSSVTLFGAGPATKIAVADATDDHAIEAGDGSNAYSNIIVADLSIDGNSAGQTANKVGVYIRQSTTDCRVERCYIDDVKGYGIYIHVISDRNILQLNTITNSTMYGVYLGGSTEGNICSNNVVKDSGDYGIVSFAAYNVIEGNMCMDNGKDGIHVEYSENMVIGNHCQDNGWSGIDIWSVTERNIVHGNYCDSNDYHGIVCYGEYNSITGNSCLENEYYGIWIGGGHWNTVTGNTCMNNSQYAGNNYDGIRISDTSTYNTITGNTCCDDQGTATQKYGINEKAAVDDYNIILGNICRGNATGGINSSGANSDVAHNQT